MRRLMMVLVAAALAVASGQALAKPGPSKTPKPQSRSWSINMSSSRGRLGAEVMSMTPELRTHFKAPRDAGVLVSRVEPDSPAARADLKVGDIITRVAGQPIDQPWDVRRALAGRPQGEVVDVEVVRQRLPRTLRAKLTSKAASGAPPSGFDFDFHFPELPGFPQFDEDWFDRHFELWGKGKGKDAGKGRRAPSTKKRGSPALRKQLRDTQKKLRELERRLKRLERKTRSSGRTCASFYDLRPLVGRQPVPSRS